MIRAQMATFPARQDIMLQTVASISSQVDQMYICLNEFTQIPVELASIRNVTAVIPATDLKDVGKFYFPPSPEDIVFTIDDDIIYPASYVTDTLQRIDMVGLDGNVFGYMANAWVFKKQKNTFGWRNYKFGKACKDMFAVDILGTGTAVMLGKDVPPIDRLSGSTGFVDIRFSQWQKNMGNHMWTLPRTDAYLSDNLPPKLQDSSLFHTVARSGGSDLEVETRKLISMADPCSGKPWRNVHKKRRAIFDEN